MDNVYIAMIKHRNPRYFAQVILQYDYTEKAGIGEELHVHNE